jgi:hypothetical protein
MSGDLSVNPSGVIASGVLFDEIGVAAGNIRTTDLDVIPGAGGDPADPFWGTDSYGLAFAGNWVPALSTIGDLLDSTVSYMQGVGHMTVDTGQLYGAATDVNTGLVSGGLAS